MAKSEGSTIVFKDGHVHALYSDRLRDIVGAAGIESSVQIHRASHVDVTRDLTERAKCILRHRKSIDLNNYPNAFWAEIIDWKDVLGPFRTRQEALEAEVEYLEFRLGKKSASVKVSPWQTVSGLLLRILSLFQTKTAS